MRLEWSLSELSGAVVYSGVRPSCCEIITASSGEAAETEPEMQIRETAISPNYSRISGIAYENGYVRENSSKTDTLQSFPPKKGALLPWGSDNF